MSLAVSPARRIFSERSSAEKPRFEHKAVAQVVAVEDEAGNTAAMELIIQAHGESGFTGAGEAGQPDDGSAMAKMFGAQFRG